MDNRRCFSPAVLYSLVIIGILTTVLILVLPIRSAATLWQQYRILAVSPTEFEKEIVSGLHSAGIVSIVTQTNSMLPRGNRLSPVQPFIDEVNRQRNSWFVHEESGTRFFFLPDTPDMEKKAGAVLDSLPITWYLEGNTVFYYYLLVPLVLLLAVGLVLQKNRRMSLAAALPAFFLAFSWNSPSGMFAASLLLATVVIVSDLLYSGPFRVTPEQLARRVRHNGLLLVPLTLPLVLAVLHSFRAGILFLSALVCTAVIFLLFKIFAELLEPYTQSGKRLHASFRCVPMHPETLYRRRFFSKQLFVSLALVIVVSSGVTALVYRSGRGKNAITSDKQLYLPSPSGYTDREGFSPEAFNTFIRLNRKNGLPDLADFLAVQWKIAVFPWKDYRDLPEPPQAGDTMIVHDYVFNEQQGRLVANPRVVAVFDRDFINTTLSTMATPLEKMLVTQEQFVSGRITRHPE